MIKQQYLNALHTIHARLEGNQIRWAITGSFGMALQGMDVAVHDIDIQTDKEGAYEVERRFPECVIQPVRFLMSERICSHLGELEICGIKVEIMGDLQKRLGDGSWEKPVDVNFHKRQVEIEGMKIPVLSLEYEYQAYLKMGRIEKAELLRNRLQKQANDPSKE